MKYFARVMIHPEKYEILFLKIQEKIEGKEGGAEIKILTKKASKLDQ